MKILLFSDSPDKSNKCTYVDTNVLRRNVLSFVPVLLIITCILAVMVFIVKQDYKSPPFEKNVVRGVPDVSENYDYGEVNASDVFSFYITGVLYQQEDGSVKLYFTNPSDNEANLLCEIFDKKGTTLYKSGLLRPGEYVENLYPVKKPANEATDIEIKVYAFENETYYSLGTITLDNVLQGK